LDETQQELMKAERESAWKEMAQQVAHEIKNPLTPMKLNLQHLQRQLEANPDNILELRPVIERTASNIIEQIESLNKIASDFSKFAKPVSEPLEPLNILTLLNSVVDLYKPDTDITVQIHNNEKELIINGVEDELRRVFINLFKNALEASKGKKCKINISAKKLTDEIVIEIKDNGSGIDAADKDKIFLPKFSTKSSGTGLGLAITKQIIEAHQGKIHFTSKKGVGTRFYIHLPLSV
jgi:nitrogen fixation/metabolism regulation signal transduction histidine kinase